MVIANLLLSVLFVSGACTPCSKKPDLEIAAPKTVHALSGSCLQIPCKFSPTSGREFDGRGQISGVWIKRDSRYAINPDNVVFNSSRRFNYTMDITGNLSQKNCTTLFPNVITSHSDTYFFRVESNPFSATASCSPVKVIVQDSPPSPRIEISGDLKENQSVTITCSALTPCPRWPPKLTWNLQKDSHNNMEENTDESFTTKIQESITLSDQHDGYNISCSATYPVNEGEEDQTAEETQTLSVLYAPKDTSVSISPSGLVSAGTRVNLTCSSRAKPPVSSFTWFKISNNSRPMIVFIGEFYSFNATDGGTFYCVASNDQGCERSSEVHVNIGGLAGGSISESLLGGIIGGILLIFLIVGIILALVFWSRSKSNDSSQQNLYQTGEELAAVESKKESREEDEEGIHYGEIDFTKQRPPHVQDGGQQQETLYAQVKGASAGQTTDGPEDLYAHVKKN